MATTCIPFANGVPAASGPPIWWNQSGPVPALNTRIDDPRWRGCAAKSYPTGGGGAGEHATFRALHHTEPSGGEIGGPLRFLYLSWHVKVDPQLNVNDDRLFVGFAPAAGGTPVVIRIRPFVDLDPAAVPDGVPIPFANTATFLRTGGAWTPRGGVEPAWISENTGFGRTWIFRSRPLPNQPGVLNASWAINLRVPMRTGGGISDGGIELGNQFRMWFDLQVRMPDGTTTPHRFPRTAPGFAGINFPDPDGLIDPNDPAQGRNWDDFQLGSTPTACTTGVSLLTQDVDTDNTPDHVIRFVRPPAAQVTNTFHARPLNNTGTTIPAGGIGARFRLANWGSQPDWNNVTDPSQLWTDVRGGSNATGGAILNGQKGDLTFGWALNSAEMDQFDPPGGGTPPRRKHQCMLVELSGAGIDFLNNSVYRNMDVEPLAAGPGIMGIAADDDDSRAAAPRTATFARDAQISVKALSPLGGPRRDVYVYVESTNMPRTETPAPDPDDGQVRALRDQLLAGNGLAEVLVEGASTIDELARFFPTYRIHVWHTTGETTADGLRVLAPQSSFGYVLPKDGASFGWDHELVGAGLQEIAPNFYKVAVPNGGAVEVATQVRSWNRPRPTGAPAARARAALDEFVRESRTADQEIRRAQEDNDEEELDQAREALERARGKVRRIREALDDDELEGTRERVDMIRGDVDHAQGKLYRAQEQSDEGHADIRRARAATQRALNAVDDAHDAFEDARGGEDHPELRRAHRALERAHERLDDAQGDLRIELVDEAVDEIRRARGAIRRAQEDIDEDELDQAREALGRAREKIDRVREAIADNRRDGVLEDIELAQEDLDHAQEKLHRAQEDEL